MVVAVEMGLGHLRPASAVANALGQPLLHADRAPLTSEAEQQIWRRSRVFYEGMTRLSQLPAVGAPLRALVGAITHIPHLHPGRDLSAPSGYSRFLERLIRRGLGRGLVDAMRRDGVPLFTTYFASALAADFHGCDGVGCLVTDSDLARAWVACDPARSRMRYFAPTDRVVRRLKAYGVPPERIELTGFPLPDELVGGPDLPVLRRHLGATPGPPGSGGRVPRLERARDRAAPGRLARAVTAQPPLLVFAVGGAGAQAELPGRFLPSLRAPIEAGLLRVALLAGVKPHVAERFHALVGAHGARRAPRACEWWASPRSRLTSAPATRSSPRPTSCGPSPAR